jgi:thymidylate synthase
MRVIEGDTYAELYRNVIDEVLNKPDYVCSPRDMKVSEITNAIMVLKDPTSNLFKNEVRSIPYRYLAGELLWYFSGRKDVKFISEYSTFWEKIANEDGTNNSAYGNLLFKEKNYHMITEWQWALHCLVQDKDTRQAILRFNKPNHSYKGVKDFVCTLNGVFNIRDDKLNFTVIMRSNDIHLGLTYDLPFFTLLQQQMHRQLLPTYPNLQLGEYTHHSISLHAYERNWEQLQSMLEVPFEADGLSLDIDLIQQNGETTVEFNRCFSSVFQKSNDFESNSKFLTWIHEKALKL